MTRSYDERWMRGADRDGARHAIKFDPVVEGARHGLSRELSLELWKLVREESATPEQADLERAKPRFHELATQVAARGAKLRQDVGRLTRVAVELDGVPTARAAIDALQPHVPGRKTQVIVEAQRWASLEPRPELPGAEVVASALAELTLAAPRRFSAATLHRSGEAPVDDDAAHDPTIAAALSRRGGAIRCPRRSAATWRPCSAPICRSYASTPIPSPGQRLARFARAHSRSAWTSSSPQGRSSP